MKEFGVYNVKPTYLAKFVGVENQLAALKLTVRPFVCVKIKDSDGQLRNWLIPLSSINPLAKDYSYSDRMNNYIENAISDGMELMERYREDFGNR